MRRFLVSICMVTACCVFTSPVFACMKYGESVSVSLAQRGSSVDFDRLRLFFLFKQDVSDEVRYQSIADGNLVVIISRSQWQNERKQNAWAYTITIRPRTYQDRAVYDFHKALRMELERLMRNDLLRKFTEQDKEDILALKSFGDMVSYRGEAGVGWESSVMRGPCGGPVEVDGEVPVLALPR